MMRSGRFALHQTHQPLHRACRASPTDGGLLGFTRKNALMRLSASLSISASAYCQVWLPSLRQFLAASMFTTLKAIAVEVSDLDVGRECRHRQRDGVAAMQQVVLHQRIEDVTHRRGAALDGKDVELAGRRSPVAHLLGEELMHNALASSAASGPARDTCQPMMPSASS